MPDVQRDQDRMIKAQKYYQTVVDKYPKSEYVTDAKYKIQVAKDQLAGREMKVGRYYLQRANYTAAINRFREVLGKYQSTRHTEEALYRLVEGYLKLGIVNEAQTAAAVLGHNYPEFQWYKDAYALLKTGNLEPHESSGILDFQERSKAGRVFREETRRSADRGASDRMLVQLAIRDIVLIDRIDFDSDRGLTVLTGETGAGKSILLDAFALALGGRGDGSLVRSGQPQGQVTAVFDLAAGPSRAHAAARAGHRGRRRSHPAPRADGRRPHAAPSSTTRRSARRRCARSAARSSRSTASTTSAR